MTATHPAADRRLVLAWLDDTLDEHARAAFEAHLCVCRRCRWELRFDLSAAERAARGPTVRTNVLTQVRDAARRELVRAMRELVHCCLVARGDADADLLVHGRAADFDEALAHARTLAARLHGAGLAVDLSALPDRLPSADVALAGANRVLDTLDAVAGRSAWADIARALVLRLDGRLAESIALTRETLATCGHPRLLACAFVNLCSTLVADGRFVEALAAADDALLRDGGDVLALAVSLACLEALGRRGALAETRARLTRVERERPSLLARRLLRTTRDRGRALAAPALDDDLRVPRSA